MTALLLLVPLVIVVITQILALVGMPGEAHLRDLALARWALPWALSAIGAVGGAACVALALVPRSSADRALHVDVTAPPVLLGLSLVTAAAVVAGPLAWGRAVGEFHLSHHLVRGLLLIVVLVLYWRYVAVHR